MTMNPSPTASATLDAPSPDPGISYDVAVIGAGVVGCAVTRRLTLDGARVVLLEKGPDILDGASKGNSGLLHTGFDAPPDSLEQRCVADGFRLYREIRERLSLPLMETGALVLAWSIEEEERLEQLITQARHNGVTDVRRLTRAEILAREPALSRRVRGGFLVPGESVIDPWSAPLAYLLQAMAHGAEVRRATELLFGRFNGARWTLKTSTGSLTADTVINCAGLYGDLVDERLGLSKRFSIRPRKGQFVVFEKAARALVRSILLPVPTEKTKGVVICRTIYGNLLVGPTAEDQDSRTDRSVDHAALEALRAKGLEMVPGLADIPVTAVYAGLRPATEDKGYRVFSDPDRRQVTVGGIRSTGLSSALGLAEHVAGLLSAFPAGAGTAMTAPRTPVPAEAVHWPAVPVLAEPESLQSVRLTDDPPPRDWAAGTCGDIVCHCELVTRREIVAALNGPLPAKSLAGLKRRTRVTMGRCQGFYCMNALAELTRGHFESDEALSDDRP